MNADFADVLQIAGVLCAYLVLVALGLCLMRRVAIWVRDLGPRRDRRLARGLLGFTLGHGLTLTLGGFALVLVVVGLRDKLPAGERADMVRAMWTCFVVGPLVAVSAWTSLRYLRP
jgi:hypothetical protein